MILRRLFAKTSIPHPWFEQDHPMLKPDLQMQKLIRYIERKRGNSSEKIEEIQENSFDEFNSDPTPLYKVTDYDFTIAPELLPVFLKLHANCDPESILHNIDSFPGADFNRSLQKLPDFETNYTIEEMETFKGIDERYVISRFAPPRFKQLMDRVLARIPMFGWTVPMKEYQSLSDLDAALSREIHVFFYGEGPFFDVYERSIYRRALLRQTSTGDWADEREIPFVTESEDNFLQGMINWAGSEDFEYGFQYRPYFREFHFDQEYFYGETKGIVQRLSRLVWYKQMHQNPRKNGEMIATMLVERLKKYISCPEFRYTFNIPTSFIARNNLLILHIWMITYRLMEIANHIVASIGYVSWGEWLTNSQTRFRLRNSNKVLKMIQSINKRMNKIFKDQTEKSLYRVKIHPSPRKKIKTLCEKQAEQATFLLYKFYETDNLLDLLQTIFYPHKRETRPFFPFVHQIHEYVQTHRDYLRTLTLEDIVACNIEWDVLRMDLRKVNDEINTNSTDSTHIEVNDLELTEEDIEMIEGIDQELENIDKK